jgi:2-polyprenyl-3-methyl-5-hydroxy-6-metoxy-1,4-benzoquinol methylase
MAHYLIIVGYADRLSMRPRILDVGCGDGVLRGHFAGVSFEEYVGLDISSVAVQKADAKQFPNTTFLVADFDKTSSLGAFDIVVFNESIYYAPDPLQTFISYRALLRPRGAIIVSIHDTGLRTAAMWRRFERFHASTYSTLLSNERNQTWDVRAFVRPDRESSGTVDIKS